MFCVSFGSRVILGIALYFDTTLAVAPGEINAGNDEATLAVEHEKCRARTVST